MVILNHEQHSEEWYESRRGVPSASNFDKIVTTKGIPSASRIKYLYKLAGELVSGSCEDNFQSAAMARGNELEEEARRLYQIVTDEEIKQVGFCLSDDYRYGCSPDGLVGSKGMIEIKCPLISTHVEYLLKGQLPTTYFQQVQGQLLVTGREWCDFVSYFPRLRPLQVRVCRDEEFLTKLQAELINFCDELETVTKQIGGISGN